MLMTALLLLHAVFNWNFYTKWNCRKWADFLEHTKNGEHVNWIKAKFATVSEKLLPLYKGIYQRKWSGNISLRQSFMRHVGYSKDQGFYPSALLLSVHV